MASEEEVKKFADEISKINYDFAANLFDAVVYKENDKEDISLFQAES